MTYLDFVKQLRNDIKTEIFNNLIIDEDVEFEDLTTNEFVHYLDQMFKQFLKMSAKQMYKILKNKIILKYYAN